MHYLLLDEAPGEVRGAVLAKEEELQRHTCSDEPGELRCPDALEASRKRGQNTQRASFSFSFLIALSPYTVDYCLSYKLFKMRWHGHGLATQ
ncbi:putative cancer susceptibility gene HEPN1 protein [Camelus ferus]|uniref:Cancer susceptibility gene HEPN1 protein n=2 Tax=Camelus TaxID=9836 RepID=A0A8B8SEK7_CAMFR|nr:putative cancer susceptibility gene HEPN1 protein [Camelus ferus]